MQNGSIKNFFPGGNTSKGFYSFYQFLPYKAERIFIIKGGPGTGKSSFMKKIGYEMNSQGCDIEFHWCSSDNNSLDGLVIPSLKVAFLDGTAPHIVDPANPGVVEEILYLGDFWHNEHLYKYKQEIIQLNLTVNKKFKQVYHYLKIAKLVYDGWKKYYTDNLHFDKINKDTILLIKKILANKPILLSNSSNNQRHLFASAITPEGYVHHFDNLTKKIKNRYIIKGKPGTGKSTLIKNVAKVLYLYNYNILYLHCPLDPDNLNAITVPKLDLAIIDGTDPHTLNTIKDSDQIIDMSSYICNDIMNFREEIEEAKDLFLNIMNKVFHFLKQAKQTHDQLEKYYIDAMNFNSIEQARQKIVRDITS